MYCEETKYDINRKIMGSCYFSDLIFYYPFSLSTILWTLQWLSISLKVKAKALKLTFMSLQDLPSCFLSNFTSILIIIYLLQEHWLPCFSLNMPAIFSFQCFYTCYSLPWIALSLDICFSDFLIFLSICIKRMFVPF